jgi:hypothetical protein
MLSLGISKLLLIMTIVVLVLPVWFAGSSGQSYGSIVESARSRYIPFFSIQNLLFCFTTFQA